MRTGLSQHTSLLTDIEALIECAPDGQRGELILNEVGRNHEEMAWILTSLLRGDDHVALFVNDRNRDSRSAAEDAKENGYLDGSTLKFPMSIASNDEDLS